MTAGSRTDRPGTGSDTRRRERPSEHRATEHRATGRAETAGEPDVVPPERTDALRRLRGSHEAAVLAELRRSGGLSRSALMTRTGLSRTTLSEIVSDLLERGTVAEKSAAAEAGLPRQRGRPAQQITLNARGAELIGIDLRRTRLQVVIANSAHEVVGRRECRLPARGGPDERGAAIAAAVEELARAGGLDLGPVQGIGLGLPGYVHDPATADPAVMTPDAARTAAALRRHFRVPVVTDNNARLAALAEVTWGAARGYRDIVYARWSEGVGGGLVVDGRLVYGAHGVAGELGHVSHDPAGAPCHCGGRGCLEGRISVPAMLAACAARGGTPGDAAGLLAQAAAGQEPARTVVTDAATDLGRGLAALAAQTDPECLVIDGEPATLGDLVLTPLREQLAALSLPSASRSVHVRAAALGDNAAALGAVALLLRTAGQGEELPDIPLPGGPSATVHPAAADTTAPVASPPGRAPQG